jgi:hypothetical protein
MVNMKKSGVAVYVVFLFALTACPADYYADNWRELFLLPRSSAMAGSDYVFARDGSPFTNAANLAFDSTIEISLSYASFYQNVFSTSILSYAGRIDRNSGFGISMSYLYNPDIIVTTGLDKDIDGNPIYDESKLRSLSESMIYFRAGYAYSFSAADGITMGVGGAVNAQRHRLPANETDGYGIGLDAGLAADFYKTGLRLSLGCDNLTTNYTRWSAAYSETALPHLRLGVGWDRDLPYVYGHVKMGYKTLDLLSNEGANGLDNSSDTAEFSSVDQAKKVSQNKPVLLRLGSQPGLFLVSGGIGIEYTIKNAVAIRFGGNGIPPFTTMFNYAFGCGVNLFKKRVSLDFSYLDHELAATYQIGVVYRR